MTGETHADSLAIPADIQAKADFYTHVTIALEALLSPAGPDTTTSNLFTAAANASSLLFGSFENYGAKWGREPGRRVNWSGFYLHPALLLKKSPVTLQDTPSMLLLGPFHGRPACSSVSLKATSKRPVGVCAASYLEQATVIVPDVNARPGHIACDGVTQSEIVLALRNGQGTVVGVLDIDCEAIDGFDADDQAGLERFIAVFERLVNWEL